jgi:hypothetical protein
MSTPLDDMQARYDSEYKEQLEFAKERDWQGLGFDSPEDMMWSLDLFTDEENTIFEDGWRAGYLDAMEDVRKWYRAEGYSV